MFARLWWKEARLFWPLWMFVALIAVAGQWLVLWYFGSDARNGTLGAMAIGWTCLYGFAVSAAAFAGEREGRTLLFLDTLAVSRMQLWGSKVSFALATTLAMAVVLSGIAALATDRWEIGQERLVPVVLGCVALLLETLGWGLLWSAVSASALTAAALAFCSMGVAGLIVQQEMWFSTGDLVSTAAMHLGLALTAAATSAVVLTLDGPGRPALGRSSRLGRSTGQRQSAWRRGSLIRRSTRPDGGDPVRAPRTRPAALAAVRSLAWLTAREAFPIWWRSVALHLGLIYLLLLSVIALGGWGWLLPVNLVIALLAGVNVFGTEARARTHRFLAHHGVSPGWAWAVKVAVWAGALLSVWGILAASAVVMFYRRELNNGQEVRLYAAALINAFVIAQLCGMAIRRGITAALVATVAMLALMIPLGGLYGMKMLPSGGLFVISPALLFVGWAWSRDWLLDRPGPARWVRLSLLLVTSFGVLFIGYVIHRVESVPDLRPALVDYLGVSVPSPGASPEPTSADLYREAARRLTPLPAEVQAFSVSGDPNSFNIEGFGTFETTNPAGVWLRENAEVLALIRRATLLPRSPIVPIAGQTLFSGSGLIEVRGLAVLVAVSIRERRERGDLAGAWEYITVLLRMARHLNGPLPLGVAFQGLNTEGQALSLAMNWAVDSRQTPERLRASLAEYRRLQVPFSDASESIRVEARLAEQTVDLPRAELAEKFLRMVSGPGDANAAMATTAWSNLVTTRWEIARARRAFPLLFAAKVVYSGFEPRQRVHSQHLTDGWYGFRAGSGSAAVVVSEDDLSHIQKSTPLARQLFPPVDALIEANDRNEVARRALIQILALRSWQVQHEGRLPDRLDELVPSELDQLPVDPYADKVFSYIPSEGQPLLPLEQFEQLNARFQQSKLIPTAGHRLLYSFGQNRQNDGALADENMSHSSRTDIIFPLPEFVPDVGKAGDDPKAPPLP